MNAILLQEKIDRLLNSVHLLLPDGGNMGYVYSDDLAQLNKSSLSYPGMIFICATFNSKSL